jgi:beta-glucosidase
MKNMGIKGYRFSISWPRVMPQGFGATNLQGLDFYDRLVDNLLMAGIEPHLTLYHWDLPQALQDKGGFANRDVLDYFADYAALMTHRLGDRVKYWTTFNEPWCITFLGNRSGDHAPGFKDEKLALQVSHNVLVAHGKASQAIRSAARANKNLQVGIVNILAPQETLDDNPKSKENAELQWQKDATWFLDPLFKAYYPPKAWRAYGNLVPEIKAGDMALISQPLDYLGVNYYFRTVQGPNGQISPVPGSPQTDIGWEVNAPAFKNLLLKLNEDYKLPPIFITENGAAYNDTLSPDGQVHDEKRIAYLHDHLDALNQAIKAGVNVKGYFLWSLLDNFEWAYGYDKRFGIVYVDYKTLKRYPKDSAKWYQQVISQNKIVETKLAVAR